MSISTGTRRTSACAGNGASAAGRRLRSPARTGFGSRMIERALATQLSGAVTIDYRASGLVCTIDAPMAAIKES